MTLVVLNIAAGQSPEVGSRAGIAAPDVQGRRDCRARSLIPAMTPVFASA